MLLTGIPGYLWRDFCNNLLRRWPPLSSQSIPKLPESGSTSRHNVKASESDNHSEKSIYASKQYYFPNRVRAVSAIATIASG